MRTIAFFNNKGGVGKTTLVYHVAWMCAEMGRRVLAVDLDPQANLTTMFLDEDTSEKLWPESGPSQSIFACISPIIEGLGGHCRGAVAADPLASSSSPRRLGPLPI